MNRIPLMFSLFFSFLISVQVANACATHCAEAMKDFEATTMPLPNYYEQCYDITNTDFGFRSPLGIPLVLAGNFGELRNNHFHAGIDCKTNGSENYRIYSIADGYVSRIKVSSRGYGKALYITHYNGYTSVYAHLNEFKGAIGAYLKQQQYSQQKSELDIQIPAGVLPVTQSQVVALSGNTGSSTAPHLHFEIRDAHTEEALNPLLFGFKIADTRKPIISGAALYQFDQSGRRTKAKTIEIVKNSSGNFSAKSNVINVGTPRVGLGIKAYDKQDAANNLNGAFSVEMLDNGVPVYSFKMDRIAFHESRYINSHCDYTYKKEGKGWMQKCFRDPGNQLSIYETAINDGIIDLSDGLMHKVIFKVRDVSGNTKVLAMNLKYKPSIGFKAPYIGNYQAMLPHNMPQTYSDKGLNLNFEAGSFYDNIPLKHTTKPSTSQYVYSDIHKVHDGKTPVHKYFDVAINGSRVPDRLRNKVLIARKNSAGRVSSIGGEWEGGYLKASSKEFGSFYITVDTRPPVIQPINISNGKSMAKNSTITFKISDNLSGIKSYNAYIDGNWVLMEYDAKSARLRYRFDGRVGRGNHSMKLVVVDGRGNEAVWSGRFSR